MKFINYIKSRNGREIDFSLVEARVEETAKKYNLLLLYIYGSYAFNKADKLSDIDVAYLAENEFNFDTLINFLQDLQDIFEDEAIDLVDLKYSPLTLTHRIFKYGRCLYAKNLRTKIDFETQKDMQYMDTFFLRNIFFNNLQKRLRDGTYGHR